MDLNDALRKRQQELAELKRREELDRLSKQTYEDRAEKFKTIEANYMKDMTFEEQANYMSITNTVGKIDNKDLLLAYRELYLHFVFVRRQMLKYAKSSLLGEDL